MWLTRNRWYLAALAVLLPAAFLVAASTDWFRYAEAQAGHPIAVQSGQSVEYAGATFSMLASDTIAAESEAGVGANLVQGTSLVTATLQVDPGSKPPFCDVQLTDTAGDRRWPEALYRDADFAITEDAESYCSTEAEGPYKLQVYFVVPSGAAEHPRLELRVTDSLPDFLVFNL